MLNAAVLIIVISSKYSFLWMVAYGRGKLSYVRREARYHVICLFDDDEDDRRTEHEEATKRVPPLILQRRLTLLVDHTLLSPKGPKQDSPGQSAATPWVTGHG